MGELRVNTSASLMHEQLHICITIWVRGPWVYLRLAPVHRSPAIPSAEVRFGLEMSLAIRLHQYLLTRQNQGHVEAGHADVSRDERRMNKEFTVTRQVRSK